MSGDATRRALIVTHYFPAHGGGVEMVAGQLAQRLARAGVAIEWFASATDEAPNYSGVECKPQAAFNVFERRFGIPFPIWSLPGFARLFNAVRRASVVHIHDAIYLANFLAALFAMAMGKRLVVTQHVGFIPYDSGALRLILAAANRVAAEIVLRRADATVFVSPVVRRYFERLAGPSAGYLDIPNGVDANLFSSVPDSGAESARQRLGVRHDVPMLLFVGRFVEKKGLQTIRRLAERAPDWQWYLTGEGPIDPRSWHLDNVHVLGRLAQSELASLYRGADALVLPSFGEGFPLVVQEALSSGLPVAVHTETRDAGGLPSAICVAEDVHGADATDRWIDALRTLIHSSPEEQRARRVACTEFALKQWSWDTTCRHYQRVMFEQHTEQSEPVR